ncbi:hypothetical protein EHP00_1191 [Ecytonucleospora hepatopenaei]|uniref:Uncharacterized protein n=1 Tax=Ecytonucleospora hepatopenaei TaxID=646526 RepID=A0A1W0E889_9MICR|nr:hypothetical protein EHP00_1191 [Ecytonucleospora hepatopenaei]
MFLNLSITNLFLNSLYDNNIFLNNIYIKYIYTSDEQLSTGIKKLKICDEQSETSDGYSISSDELVDIIDDHSMSSHDKLKRKYEFLKSVYDYSLRRNEKPKSINERRKIKKELLMLSYDKVKRKSDKLDITRFDNLKDLTAQRLFIKYRNEVNCYDHHCDYIEQLLEKLGKIIENKQPKLTIALIVDEINETENKIKSSEVLGNKIAEFKKGTEENYLMKKCCIKDLVEKISELEIQNNTAINNLKKVKVQLETFLDSVKTVNHN